MIILCWGLACPILELHTEEELDGMFLSRTCDKAILYMISYTPRALSIFTNDSCFVSGTPFTRLVATLYSTPMHAFCFPRGLSIFARGAKQMSLPGVFGLAAGGACKEAPHHLDQHMGDVKTFRHSEM